MVRNMTFYHLRRSYQSLIKALSVISYKTDSSIHHTIVFPQMCSLVNNWRKLKPELVPEAEQALVLICQGLFKKAVLVGFSVMLANKCEVSPGMLKNVSTFSYKHTVKTHRKVTGGCVSQGFIKIHCILCFYAIWVWLQSNSLHTNWVNQLH